MQDRFRELDIFSFSISEGFIPITDSGITNSELVTIFLDKTQVWPRKSILYVQISQTLLAKYFSLIRDNHKTFLVMKL